MATILTKATVTTLLVTVAILCPPSGDIAHAERTERYLKVTNLAPGRVLLLRSGPSRSFEPIGILPYGARHVRNYGCKNLATGNWCEVRYRGTRGWASKRYLAPDKGRRV